MDQNKQSQARSWHVPAILRPLFCSGGVLCNQTNTVVDTEPYFISFSPTIIMSLDTHTKHIVMPGISSNSLKRKRLQPYLSSPPPELHDLQEQEQEQHSCRREYQKEQATQTDLAFLYRTPKGLAPAWTGRGRSPYKTPVTAVLDGIKDKTGQLEHFERELIIQQAELDSWIAEKRVRLESVAAQKARISMERPPLGVIELAPPSSTSRGRSSSPDKYLRALRNGKPPILDFALAQLQDDIPQSVSDLLADLMDDLGDGCIPAQYKVLTLDSLSRQSVY